MGMFQFEWFDVVSLIVIGSILLVIIQIMRHEMELKRLTTIKVTKKINIVKEKKKKKNKFSYLHSLRKKIDFYYQFKKDKKGADTLYFGIVMAEVVTLVAFLLWGKPIFAIAFPLTIHVMALKVLDLKTLTIHHYVQTEMPNAIKHLVKVMSNTGDLKTMMYETSRHLNQPLSGMFSEMSRRMMTENYEVVLMDYAEEMDDIWFYAFAFLMVSYKEQSKKEDIIINLTTLGDMMRKENQLKEKSITDKKFVTIMNYALGAIAIALALYNFVSNTEHSYPFFFNQLTGMVAFMMGVWSLAGTFLINLTMSSRAD